MALDGFANFETKEEEILFFFERLNEHGQEAVLKNIRIIAGNPDCQRTAPPESANDNDPISDTPEQKKPPESEKTPNDGK